MPTILMIDENNSLIHRAFPLVQEVAREKGWEAVFWNLTKVETHYGKIILGLIRQYEKTGIVPAALGHLCVIYIMSLAPNGTPEIICLGDCSVFPEIRKAIKEELAESKIYTVWDIIADWVSKCL